MLRFPNPSSKIRNFVRAYTVAHQELAGKIVQIDDIVRAVVGDNLATSSGHIGDEAIARSTKSDRSRDPLYNQVKMYAELFRVLGWIHSTETALRYTFTALGSQVAIAGQYYADIVAESALGITYPNPNIRSRTKVCNLRPFGLLLRMMAACEGELSRDEMIIGPLSAQSDQSQAAFNRTRARVLNTRLGKPHIKDQLQATSKELHVQINTLRNYTRWPIGLMRDLGWTTKRGTVYALTALGKEIADRVRLSVDLRATHISSLSKADLRTLSLFAHYRMLERSGFDVSSVGSAMDRSEPAISRTLAKLAIPSGADILFSPFQALPTTDVRQIFGESEPEDAVRVPSRNTHSISPIDVARSELSTNRLASHLQRRSDMALPSTTLSEELRRHFAEGGSSSERAAQTFVNSHRHDSMENFYPLVRDLFLLLGLRCELPRTGVNYQRFDACLWFGDVVLPIEIKSPAEEIALSTKALRQAVENKIVLLSRGSLPTTIDTSSLVVGFQLPNDRSDLSLLVEDVFVTYCIRIGIIGLHTLAVAGMRRLCEGREVAVSAIAQLKGMLHV